MVLLVPTFLASVIALLLGRSLRSLAALPVRSGNLILVSLSIQVLIYFPVLRHSSLVLDHASAIYLGALALAVAGMLRNWHLGLPLRIAALGLLLNTAVIAANGGHMPVNAAALGSVQSAATVIRTGDPHTYGNTQLANHSDQLLPLSDVIPIPMMAGFGNVYSVGDMLISSGIALLVYRGMGRRAPGPLPARPVRPEMLTS
jgi:hypothetical protein